MPAASVKRSRGLTTGSSLKSMTVSTSSAAVPASGAAHTGLRSGPGLADRAGRRSSRNRREQGADRFQPPLAKRREGRLDDRWIVLSVDQKEGTFHAAHPAASTAPAAVTSATTRSISDWMARSTFVVSTSWTPDARAAAIRSFRTMRIRSNRSR